ncbi:MAG TPA: hypothetical protein VMV31_10410 [Terriglobales bacterium]|nr:hypothetical protein [Terriglobales bacterium]
MSAKYEDAQLILKLYELRREAVLREARNWFFRDFQPTSAASIFETLKGEHSAFYRMVTTYWEMACTLVQHGAIDAELFRQANGEHIYIFAKLEPFLADLRQEYGNPNLLGNLEKVVRSMPNADTVLKHFQARIAAMAAAAKAR